MQVIVDHAQVTRRGKTILGPVDLRLNGVGITAIIGPNGAGKTTLLRLIHGLERARTGMIRFDPPMALRAQSFVFQSPVFLRRTVADNLGLPLQLRGVGAAQIARRVAQKATDFGLTGLLNHDAQMLSGGEQQKLALARALITDPALVFLDEPTASLDVQSARFIETVLMDQAAAGTMILMTSHCANQMRRLAQQVVFLDAGPVYGPYICSDFFANPPHEAARIWLEG